MTISITAAIENQNDGSDIVFEPLRFAGNDIAVRFDGNRPVCGGFLAEQIGVAEHRKDEIDARFLRLKGFGGRIPIVFIV